MQVRHLQLQYGFIITCRVNRFVLWIKVFQKLRKHFPKVSFEWRRYCIELTLFQLSQYLIQWFPNCGTRTSSGT